MDQPAACRRGSPPRLSIVFACSTRCRVTVRSVSRAGTLSPRPDPSIVGFCERQLPAHAHARGGCNRAKTVRTIAANTGIAGLWRGSGAALLRVVPSSAISFATFDRYQRALQRHVAPRRSFSTRFVAGALAGATAQVATYPLELLMARNAAYWNRVPRYTAYSTAFVDVFRSEGVFGLFRGLTPALAGMVPYAGLNFAVFETLKAVVRRQTDEPLTTPWRLACGGTAGLVAQTATYPIHLVKRRMQVSTDPVYRSFRSGFMHVLKTEGIRQGLFKGVVLTWLRGPFAVALGFTVNDTLKTLFEERAEELELAQVGSSTQASDSYSDGTVLSDDSHMETIHTLIAGALAGACAKTVIAPADRIKILYQVNPDRKFTLASAWRSMRTIARETGILGLWRGHGATLMRVIPYAALTYFSFDYYEALYARLGGEDSTKSPLSRFLCGAAAGATATAATYPLDLLRARHASHWGVARPDVSYAAAVQRVIQSEGVRALFNGLRPTLFGIIPYAGISFSLFHTAKARLEAHHADPNYRIDTPTRVALGGLAGLIAQSATYPLDIVRRRMQVHSPSYPSIRHAIVDIVKVEGKRALLKGLSLNWFKGPVSVGISFTVNDLIKMHFAQQRRAQRSIKSNDI